MKKNLITKNVTAVSLNGETISLTPEQIAISKDVSLWTKTNEEIKKLMVETQDANVEYVCLDILSWRKRNASQTSLDKATRDVSLALAPANTYLSSLVNEIGQKLLQVLILENEERKTKGLEAKDSINLSLFQNKLFSALHNGREVYGTIGASLFATSQVGKKALKSAMKDGAWRIALAEQERKRQAEIDRIWKQDQENAKEQMD